MTAMGSLVTWVTKVTIVKNLTIATIQTSVILVIKVNIVTNVAIAII